MILFDTNALLRFLLQDDEEKALFVREKMLLHAFLIPVEVVAEMVYVLSKVYQVDRQRIAKELYRLLNAPNAVAQNQKAVEFALEIFAETKLDFVDCIMIGYAKSENVQIITFAKKLKKQLDIEK